MATTASSSQHASFPPWFEVRKTLSNQPFVALPDKGRSFQVFLTRYYENDAAALANVLGNPAVNHLLDSVPCPYTLDDARSWIKIVLRPSCESYHHVIRAQDADNGLFIGCISYTPMKSSNGDRRFELGYYLSAAFQGKHIMRDAVTASLAWAAETGVTDVTVRVAEDNLASKAVIQGTAAFKLQEYREDTARPESKGGGVKSLLIWRTQ